MALLINFLSITTLTYASQDANATTLQYTPTFVLDLGLSTPLIQDILTWIQCISASYLLIATMVLHLPVVYKTAHRNCSEEYNDFWKVVVSSWGVVTDFMFVYQSGYLALAVLSIIFTVYGPIFNAFHLMSIAVRNPVARNIFMAVIYPINQLKIAAVVSVFLLYIFSTVQFFFFRSDFENGECDTLFACLIYTINWGTYTFYSIAHDCSLLLFPSVSMF